MKKWIDVYPHGTKEGDEESKFFKVLERNKNYIFQSTEAIAKESGLSLKRVEEIISKYFSINIIVQNPDNESQWAYWERCKDLIKKKTSISQKDQKERMDNLIK